MTRLSALEIESTGGTAEALLEHVKEETGMVPAILRVIANSPAVLEGFLSMQRSLDSGVLDRRLRLQISLAVSQANGSEYCVAAHSALGRAEGLSEEALRDARRANTPNRRTDAALKFAQALGKRPTPQLDDHLARLRSVGFDEAEIAEIIAQTVLVSLTNCFSHAARVIVDFPPIDLAEADQSPG